MRSVEIVAICRKFYYRRGSATTASRPIFKPPGPARRSATEQRRADWHRAAGTPCPFVISEPSCPTCRVPSVVSWQSCPIRRVPSVASHPSCPIRRVIARSEGTQQFLARRVTSRPPAIRPAVEAGYGTRQAASHFNNTALSIDNPVLSIDNQAMPTDDPARSIDKATPENKRTGSELRHPPESGDPGGLGPRFRGDDVECCLNAK